MGSHACSSQANVGSACTCTCRQVRQRWLTTFWDDTPPLTSLAMLMSIRTLTRRSLNLSSAHTLQHQMS